MSKHAVLIGLNYQPQKSSGDKNFWSDNLNLLALELDRITVISVRKHHVDKEQFTVGKCRIVVDYVSPQLLETPGASYRRRIFWREGAFPAFWGIVEKLISARRIIEKLRGLYAEEPFSHVHLMDNFGLANRTIVKKVKKFGASISVSAISYQGKNAILYHPYLKLSYDVSGLSVVAYSRAFADKLLRLGIKKDSIKRIPWGVLPEHIGYCKNKMFFKEKTGVPTDRPLFVWAGYIQQVQKKDFLLSLNCAKKALAKGLKATVYFAFKPETFESAFQAFDNPASGIYVRPTTKDLFDALKHAADIFFSPVLNKECIIAPPLTWIEFMALGIPILTTRVAGANEIIEDGKTGYMAEDDKLVDKMFALECEHLSFGEKCIKKIEEDYNIEDIAKRYLGLFFDCRK